MTQPKYISIADQEWVKPFLTAARRIKFEHDPGYISHPEVKVGDYPRTVWYNASGTIDPHKDIGYRPWSYVLILRATLAKRNPAILLADGYEPLRLKTGMLVELNIHNDHSVEQHDMSNLVFVAADYDEPAELSVAIADLKRYLLKGETDQD